MWFLKYLTKLNLVKMTTSNIVPVYKFILFCHKKTLTTITSQLQQFTDLECVVVGHNTIEITAQNVNKATAVQFLCQK